MLDYFLLCYTTPVPVSIYDVVTLCFALVVVRGLEFVEVDGRWHSGHWTFGAAVVVRTDLVVVVGVDLVGVVIGDMDFT